MTIGLVPAEQCGIRLVGVRPSRGKDTLLAQPSELSVGVRFALELSELGQPNLSELSNKVGEYCLPFKDAVSSNDDRALSTQFLAYYKNSI